jgi:hypothetical protein
MGSDYRVTIDDKKYSPQEISAMILQKLKKDARDILVRLFPKQLSPFRLISTMHSRQPKMQVRSQVWM